MSTPLPRALRQGGPRHGHGRVSARCGPYRPLAPQEVRSHVQSRVKLGGRRRRPRARKQRPRSSSVMLPRISAADMREAVRNSSPQGASSFQTKPHSLSVRDCRSDGGGCARQPACQRRQAVSHRCVRACATLSVARESFSLTSSFCLRRPPQRGHRQQQRARVPSPHLPPGGAGVRSARDRRRGVR